MSTIDFYDIRIGDKVRATILYPSGDKKVHKFVVLDRTDFMLRGHDVSIVRNNGWTFELLDRPQLSLPVGTIAYSLDLGARFKAHDGTWRMADGMKSCIAKDTFVRDQMTIVFDPEATS